MHCICDIRYDGVTICDIPICMKGMGFPRYINTCKKAELTEYSVNQSVHITVATYIFTEYNIHCISKTNVYHVHVAIDNVQCIK